MNNPLKVRIFNFFRRVFMIRILESFLVSQTTGKLPGHLICKLVPNPYQYNRGSYRVINRDEITLQVDISDYIGHYLYFGFLDPSMATLFSLCQNNYNVIDIGTNIGWVALNFAKLSATGVVIGFEPDPFNFEVCKANIARNGLLNLKVHPIGLGENSEQVTMEERTPDNRGGNRITPHGRLGSVLTSICRLDDIPDVSSLPSVDLIKLDVEGYELKVLRGAKNTLLKHKPILFIEVDDDNLRDQGDSAKNLVSFLEMNGYNSICHAENKSEKITSSTDFSHCHFDIIAR